MMTDTFVDSLSDYLDGELSAAERAAVDTHLAQCAACRLTLDELRLVVARASALHDAAPVRDLWPGVAARIRTGGRASVSVFRRALTSRLSFTLPQLAAAGLALMVLSGGLVWMAKSGDPRADFAPISAQSDHADPAMAISAAAFADAPYDTAIADLEQRLESQRAALDPDTVRVLEENLAAIDRAIAECRSALANDPANLYLNTHLADARQRKLALLRRAAALTGS
jgi:anti-sigma factor RsiW